MKDAAPARSGAPVPVPPASSGLQNTPPIRTGGQGVGVGTPGVAGGPNAYGGAVRGAGDGVSSNQRVSAPRRGGASRFIGRGAQPAGHGAVEGRYLYDTPAIAGRFPAVTGARPQPTTGKPKADGQGSGGCVIGVQDQFAGLSPQGDFKPSSLLLQPVYNGESMFVLDISDFINLLRRR